MALLPRRDPPPARPRAAAFAAACAALVCGVVVSAAPEVSWGGDDDEKSVLISSRKSQDGLPQEDAQQQAPDPHHAPATAEEPLTPIAVATDLEPKLATPPEGNSLRSPASEAVSAGSTLQRSSPRPGGDAGILDDLAGMAEGGRLTAASTLAAADASASGGPPATNIETAKFNGVQPGKTTLVQLLEVWGEPHSRAGAGAPTQQLTYELRPFKRVQVDVADGLVQSVQLELEQHAPPEQLARQLKLDRFRAAPVRDTEGATLGLVYPERGVAFSLAPHSERSVVSHVLLEPVSSQPFLLRAEEKLHGPYEQNLSDLQLATQINAEDAVAWWQLAGIELATGRFTAAEQSARRAVELDSQEAAYRLRWANCLTHLEKLPEAMAETRRVVDSPTTPAHAQAEALVQLARLRSVSATADGRTAVELYQRAIEMAGELSRSAEVEPRRAAKRVLIDAHLGMANEIAQGEWREKEKVVPQWLERASAFAEDMVRNEGAGPEVRLAVAVGALEALAAFPPSAGPAEWVREGQTAADELLAADKDELWHSRVHWELGQAYLHALRVEHARAKPADALRYGQTALGHFRNGARLREASPLGQHLVGRLYFHLGAVHAIHHADHKTAVVWYEKAAPLLVRPTPQTPGAEARLHGDALVSMGVSFWETGARDRAIELTNRGAELLKQNVATGALEESALAIAYGNLANMHKLLGRPGEANRYTEIANRAQGTARQ